MPLRIYDPGPRRWTGRHSLSASMSLDARWLADRDATRLSPDGFEQEAVAAVNEVWALNQ